jgi:hypothetical protein
VINLSSDTLDNIIDARIAAYMNNIFPVGTIVMNSNPAKNTMTGWLLMDGAEIYNIANY